MRKAIVAALALVMTSCSPVQQSAQDSSAPAGAAPGKRAAAAAAAAAADPLAWPEPTADMRPWSRWWWLGSAVDKENLTALLEQYHAAGIGGLEICPIYGAKGAESRYLPFLSKQWMEAFAHTTSEAKRLGMGIDLTTGTGWPFGGPQVSNEHASNRVTLKSFEVKGGETADLDLPKGKATAVRAVAAGGQQVDLTDKVNGTRLKWDAPAGNWKVYAVVQSGPVQKVKRAAPGGEGNVLDPYSVDALNEYLARFDQAFSGFDAPVPNGHFHDSFEYYNATWTEGLFKAFEAARGYDLRTQLPALFGDGDADTVARVKSDYRETIAELHLAYVNRWTEWAHGKKGVSRNQAHGAPGNLLDLYAAADVPETEIFCETDDRQIPMLKLAASAAHLTGRPLASAESFTWLEEHFQATLADIKSAADFLFLSEINHIVFHGIPYSPKDVDWPGWLFYASVHMGPNGGLWRDLPAFNAYVTRCQSILQSGRPSSDVLLYFPVYDLWHDNDGLLKTFTVHDQGKWLWTSSFYATATALAKAGYTYDAVSDRLLNDARASGDGVQINGTSYRAIVLPKTTHLPVATARKLAALAKGGAKVVVIDSLPSDVPGFGTIEKRRAELKSAIAELSAAKPSIGTDVPTMLAQLGIPREVMADTGLQFVRRVRDDGGHDYFIANRTNNPFDGWVTLAHPASAVAILDPMTGRAGFATTGGDPLAGASQGTSVYLQLQPNESRILRTCRSATQSAPRWTYTRPAADPTPITGTWHVEFIDGGPVLPAAYDTAQLTSWATRDDAEAKRFAGTARYTIEFDAPTTPAAAYALDLGKVAESARVSLNGKLITTVFAAPFRVQLTQPLHPGRNKLAIEVTNVAANRIADLDRRGVQWKAFHEINFVNRSYKPFDASDWPNRESGLIGPVRLIPLQTFNPAESAK